MIEKNTDNEMKDVLKNLFEPIERKDTTADLKVFGDKIKVHDRVYDKTILLDIDILRNMIRVYDEKEKELDRIRNTPVMGRESVPQKKYETNKCPVCNMPIYWTAPLKWTLS